MINEIKSIIFEIDFLGFYVFLLFLKAAYKKAAFLLFNLLYLFPMTKKQIIDSIFEIATKFSRTDESRYDEDWLSYKIDSVAAELKIAQYLKTNILDQTWLGDGGLITFHKVNSADDISISYSDMTVGKAFIPQTISFVNKDGNQDLGIYYLIDPNAKTQYYPRRMSLWGYTPEDHTNNLFRSYWRINTSLYIDKYAEKLRLLAFFVNPEDGKLIESTPIASGSIASGTVYVVKFNQVVYNGVVYSANSTFTGVGGVTTFTGTGTVYLNSQVRAYRDTDPYPASAEMIRQIELEILTKEFGIEMKEVADNANDSKDDAVKGAQ